MRGSVIMWSFKSSQPATQEWNLNKRAHLITVFIPAGARQAYKSIPISRNYIKLQMNYVHAGKEAILRLIW